jgi:murein DD-endopeptidase MepM/ murein hydrolase activator NlpD
MRAWGVENTKEALENGLTPLWRSKLRHDMRSADEIDRFESDEIKQYRAKLRNRYDTADPVCYPVPNLITDDWDYHGAAHDGVDLVCPWKQPVLAICDSKVVRVSAAGWWGSNPKPSPGHPVSDGDGIVIIESLISDGPFEKGLHFGYGHSEGHPVREGQLVRAGDVIGHAGWANGPHVHFMVNDDMPVGDFYRGTGDRDPKPFLEYAEAHS